MRLDPPVLDNMSPAVLNPLPHEVASFGPVHLEVTDLGRSTDFWHRVVGLRLRKGSSREVQLGTAGETLVTLHPGAKHGFLRGHSGLYHLAIHPPSEVEFARIIKRVLAAGWRLSPVDHTMSKAVYLLDPDGITVEITLETPSRLRAMTATPASMHAIHADGRFRAGSEPLDLAPILATLEGAEQKNLVAEGTRIGHVHLYVGDLLAAYQFYRTLGFNQALWAPGIGFGDLGAGGAFNHRIAVNTWAGVGAPQSPEGTARMRNFTITLDSKERLNEVLEQLPHIPVEGASGYSVEDPAGNRILLNQ